MGIDIRVYRSLMLVRPVSSLVKSLSVLPVESQRANGILVLEYSHGRWKSHPGPPSLCEQGAALSEKQVSLRSNVTASRNAQRTDDTVAGSAEPTY